MSFDVISNWNLIRASGFLAYFLLTLSIAAGLMQKIPTFQSQKQLMMELHKLGGWTGVLTVVFHAALLLVNHYVPYRIGELLIPFSAENDPVFSALGTISFYLFLLVMATSDFFTKRLGKRIWKILHFMVIPAWVLTILHGILIGTDSNQTWAAFVYVAGIVLVMVLLVFRFLESRFEAANSKNVN